MKSIIGVTEPFRRLRYYLAQDTLSWLRPLLVIGVLLLSSVLVFVATPRQLTLYLSLLVGMGLVLISLRWPPLGLVIASLVGMVVPNLGPSGLNATVIMVAGLLGLWILQLVISRGQPRRALSRPVWALLAFVVVAGLAFGVGQLPWFVFAPHAPLGAQLGGLSIVVLSAGTFLLAAYQVTELRWLSRMTWAFLAFAALSVTARSVLPGLGLSTQDWFQPMGSLFLIWLVAMAFGQAAFNNHLHAGWRVALGALVCLVLLFEFVFRFDFKSGWVPLFVCMGAMIGFRSTRGALVVLALAALSVPYALTQSIASEAYSLSTRLEAWTILSQIIKTSPILGLGFANYYWYTPLFPIQGYAVSFNSHNNYVDIAAQTGLLGLACFVWFFWEVGRLGWRLRKRVPAGFARAYVYGALGGLVGMVVTAMLGDWVLPFFYNIGLNGFRSSMLGWLFLGGLVSLQQMDFQATRG